MYPVNRCREYWGEPGVVGVVAKHLASTRFAQVYEFTACGSIQELERTVVYCVDQTHQRRIEDVGHE